MKTQIIKWGKRLGLISLMSPLSHRIRVRLISKPWCSGCGFFNKYDQINQIGHLSWLTYFGYRIDITRSLNTIFGKFIDEKFGL
jgi:hypothetical protein